MRRPHKGHVVAGLVSAGLLATAAGTPAAPAAAVPAATTGPAPGGAATTAPAVKPPTVTKPTTTTPTPTPTTAPRPAPGSGPTTTTPATPPAGGTTTTPTTPATTPAPVTPPAGAGPSTTPAAPQDAPVTDTPEPPPADAVPDAGADVPAPDAADAGPAVRFPQASAAERPATEESIPLPESPTSPLARPDLPAAAGMEDKRLPADRRDRAAPGIDGPVQLAAGAWAVGLPPFFIDTFRVPPFLLPIYQAAAIQYGLRWEVLAAINEVETDFGRNTNVSSAGAVGWMQFLPSTFAIYGVDANGDGRKDPYNPVDAIFSAANYLSAAGAQTDLSAAIFAYNHATWYVADVLERARLLAGLPADLVAALSGVAQARPPALGPAWPAPDTSAAGPEHTLILHTRARAPVVATADGVVTRIGQDPRLGRVVALRDVFGNTYVYGSLGGLAARYPALVDPGARALDPPQPAEPATIPATAPTGMTSLVSPLARTDWSAQAKRIDATAPVSSRTAGGRRALTAYERRLLGDPRASEVQLVPLRVGSRVIAGTVLARAGAATAAQGQMTFEIRPAGHSAQRIEPRPIVAGWKLLQRAAGRSLERAGGEEPAIGQLLLLSKPALQRRLLADTRIRLSPCDRTRVRAGAIDRRVLAALELLAADNLRPTVGTLQCAAGSATSDYATGDAVDISAINGDPVRADSSPGTETAVRRLLTLQGTMRPSEIVSPLNLDAMGDDIVSTGGSGRIRVAFTRPAGAGAIGTRISDGVLEPSAWRRLGSRLGALRNPAVPTATSQYALPDAP